MTQSPAAVVVADAHEFGNLAATDNRIQGSARAVPAVPDVHIHSAAEDVHTVVDAHSWSAPVLAASHLLGYAEA